MKKLGRPIVRNTNFISKLCSKCKENLPLNKFYMVKSGKYTGSYRSACIECEGRGRRIFDYSSGYKFCTTCRKDLVLSEFYKNAKSGKSLYRPSCKSCMAAQVPLRRNKNKPLYQAAVANRRAVNKRARSTWSNDKYIKLFYEMAKEASELTGLKYHVDHIVPLQSDFVCGLHNEHNLQVLEASANISKNNRHWPYMSVIDDELKQLSKEFYASQTN